MEEYEKTHYANILGIRHTTEKDHKTGDKATGAVRHYKDMTLKLKREYLK